MSHSFNRENFNRMPADEVQLRTTNKRVFDLNISEQRSTLLRYIRHDVWTGYMPAKTDTSQRGSHITVSTTLVTRRPHLCGNVQTSAAFTLTNVKCWALAQANDDE
jgi:hypothetical protein